MPNDIPQTMTAAVIERFGGIDEIKVQTLPVPRPGAGEVLVKVEATGVGVWDPYERQGYFADMMKQVAGVAPSFPYVMGFDGAGTIAELGEGVAGVKVGDRVWGDSFLNPKGGFYAEYAVVKADLVSPLPETMAVEAGASLGVAAATALRGLDDTLKIKAGQSVLIHGAAGGVGHVAVQLAKLMGARVLAVASGSDGVALCKELGADAAVDGKSADVAAAVKDFAPDGLDGALVLTKAEPIAAALASVKDGGTIAYPTGVDPAPKPPRDAVGVQKFDGIVDGPLIKKIAKLIASGPFKVHVAQTFPLAKAVDAQRMLDTHFLGKIALTV